MILLLLLFLCISLDATPPRKLKVYPKHRVPHLIRLEVDTNIQRDESTDVTEPSITRPNSAPAFDFQPQQLPITRCNLSKRSKVSFVLMGIIVVGVIIYFSLKNTKNK